MDGIVVCIVAFRNPDDVLNCLGALSGQSHMEFEIVICENGGAASFEQLKDLMPDALPGGQRVTCIAALENPGYAGGVNRCIDERPGASAYWVLNPDTVPQEHTLAQLVNRLEAGDADAVGGPIVLPSGLLRTCGGMWSSVLAYSRAIGMGLPLTAIPPAAQVEPRLSFISGASLLVSRRFVEVVGLMREDYFLYGEEVEWCLRGRARGMKLGYSPHAVVLHHQGTTTGSSEDLRDQARLPLYFDERNRVLTLRDTVGKAVWPFGFAGALAVIAWRYGRRGAWRAMGHALAGWRDGVIGRRGKPGWFSDRVEARDP